MTTSARASTLKVIAPADLGNFSCTACGGCCRLWGILIDEPSFERARAFLENPPAPRPNPEMPWYFEEGGKKYYTLTGDGRCVFLGKDNHCYLHAHDPMLKSMVCRDYPRLGVMTPRGFEMSMSFSSYGAFLHTLCRPEPFTLIEGDMPIPPEAVNLPESPIRDPKPFGWDTYFLVESILIEFLNRTVPLDDALIAIARFLGAVEAMPDGEALRRKLRDRSLHPVCFMEHKSVSDLGAAYHLIRRIVALRVLCVAGTPQLRSCRDDLQEFVDRLERGPAEEGVGAALYYRRLRRAHYDPSEAILSPIVRKFLQYKIFEKDFFFEFGWVRGIQILCFLYATLRLRLMVRARKSGAGAPAVADLFDPIHFVELHFTHSAKFLQFWKRVFQDNFLGSPVLAEILVRA
ncbi:MAG: hypothetical protein A3G34_03945 [Candidatus Lindowbacteria bacterium RIFCSPLOWO2_12_FULL_62_27]|nr:MAG: hypothetical protein A3G34_03945 [Candidatus Lindowbacteria bacterium RIFCSPLOWO2_12_FULL_62_27]OGH63608.1 MAG: hypothetical protein A3I06_14095 [Candidatus Lindowbacteria bacterium RIFCSPLOWO2_02_FULL_62_12]